MDPIDFSVSHGSLADGITVIDNDIVVLCDSSRSRLLIYNINNKYQYQTKTKYKPNDITAIPGTNMVVMSSDNNDYIQFIDVVRKKVCNAILIAICCHGYLLLHPLYRVDQVSYM
jgi:hypothetical protein